MTGPRSSDANGHQQRWADPGNASNPDDVLDVALYLNELQPDYLRALIYSFESAPIDIDMTIAGGMYAGDYTLAVSRDILDGSGPGYDEHPDTLEYTKPVKLEKLGQVVPVTSIPPHVPVIIELTWSPSSGSTVFPPIVYWDVGISPLDIVRDAAADTLAVTVHNVGSVDHPACGTVTVTANGAVQGSASLPAIPAQGDYTSSQFAYEPGTNYPTPKTATLVFAGLGALVDFTVSIDTTNCLGAGVEERTSANNSVYVP